MNNKFETGASTHAVNDLILFTDNTRVLAEMRDEIYKIALHNNEAPNFTPLLLDAISTYKSEFPDSHAHISNMSREERIEFRSLYLESFEEWKEENAPKQPTKIEELNSFAKELHDNGFVIIVPKKPSTWFKAFKDGAFIYVQKAYFSGFDFSTVHKPSRENGTGHGVIQMGELTMENAKKAEFYSRNGQNIHNRSKISYYSSVEDYFKGATNNILGDYIYKF